MPSDILDLGPISVEVKSLISGIGDTMMDNRTPCPQYAVADLVDHLMGLTVAFSFAARKEAIPAAPQSRGVSGTNLPGDWRDRLPQRLDDMADAWRDPKAWEGTTHVGGVTLPGKVAGVVAANELLIHGWDLARGTGQEFTGEPAVVSAAIDMLSQGDSSGNEAFGPWVEVPTDSSPLDHAVGLSGRNPAWTA